MFCFFLMRVTIYNHNVFIIFLLTCIFVFIKVQYCIILGISVLRHRKYIMHLLNILKILNRHDSSSHQRTHCGFILPYYLQWSVKAHCWSIYELYVINPWLGAGVNVKRGVILRYYDITSSHFMFSFPPCWSRAQQGPLVPEANQWVTSNAGKGPSLRLGL